MTKYGEVYVIKVVSMTLKELNGNMKSDNKLERRTKRIDSVVQGFKHVGIFGLVLLVSILFTLSSIYKGVGIFTLLLLSPLSPVVPAITLVVLRNQQLVKPILVVTLLPAFCYLVISANQIIASWIFSGSLESSLSKFRFNIFAKYPFLGIHAAILQLGYMLKFIKRKHVAQPEQDATATGKWKQLTLHKQLRQFLPAHLQRELVE